MFTGIITAIGTIRETREQGLGRLVSETCDELVAIPMHAGTESLNAGVAAGIALYAVAAARR